MANLITKLQSLKALVSDFDGVWTDGKVSLDERGIESVICSRKDTLRLEELKASGIKVVIMSKEKNLIVNKRCEKMGIECFQGIDNKIILLKKWLAKENIVPSETAFIGDDINDIECMEYVGTAFSVADGHPECKKIAHYVTKQRGGNHAVREICDLILNAESNQKTSK